MNRRTALALSTVAESSLPIMVKATMKQAIDDASRGHTTTANWIPARALAARWCTPRMQQQLEDIIASIDLTAIASGR